MYRLHNVTGLIDFSTGKTYIMFNVTAVEVKGQDYFKMILLYKKAISAEKYTLSSNFFAIQCGAAQFDDAFLAYDYLYDPGAII